MVTWNDTLSPGCSSTAGALYKLDVSSWANVRPNASARICIMPVCCTGCGSSWRAEARCEEGSVVVRTKRAVNNLRKVINLDDMAGFFDLPGEYPGVWEWNRVGKEKKGALW